MEFQNIFTERGLNSLIPFFVAIYLSYLNPKLWIICLILALNVFVFYLIVMVYAKKISENKPKTETDVYRGVISKDRYKPSAIVSILHWIIGIITLILLYPYLYDIVAYSLFWLLISSFTFNFLRMFVVHWDIVKAGFQGKL